jgi:FKBP-type peptidyl-prolyl cis-trans isomerase SlyD
MQVVDEKVVLIHYTLTNDQGDIIDSSDDGEPLAYIHGRGNIISGLESALTGKKVGDELKVTIAPEDGYGIRDTSLESTLPLSAFEGAGEIQPGMQFQTRGAEGNQVLTITSIEGDTVSVDGNHPLAGIRLNFDVLISDVREPSPEELSHGHVHGDGGHHH